MIDKIKVIKNFENISVLLFLSCLLLFIIKLLVNKTKDELKYFTLLHCINPQSNERYKLNPGDILCRDINNHGWYRHLDLGTVIHVGMVGYNNIIYNPTQKEIKKQTIQEFMDDKKILYTINFNSKYYRPLKDSIDILEKERKKKYNYDLFFDNCETKILNARLITLPESLRNKSFIVEWIINMKPIQSLLSHKKEKERFPFYLKKYIY